LGGLRAHWVGGDDGEGGGEGPVVVMLHGFGAPGMDLVPLSSGMSVRRGTRWLFPEAPLEMPWGFDARAWWMIDLEKLDRAIRFGEVRELAGEIPDGMPAARAMLLALLSEIEERHAAPIERVVLGGFSQGSMLACDAALRSERRPAGLVLLSTTMLAEAEWRPLMAARAGLPVFMSHGRQDPLLPFAAAERLRDLLLDAGCPVEWHPFNGQHEIPAPVLARASTFLSRILP
jgi:phospholipase/carboxylesterase